jgi:hypothetical protein
MEAAGLRVLFDDRTGVSPGIKFNDADLIGVPTIVVVGRGLRDGLIEVKDRRTGERRDVTLAERRGHTRRHLTPLLPPNGCRPRRFDADLPGRVRPMTRTSPDLDRRSWSCCHTCAGRGVWQRPQHLISRFAHDRATWIIEEPMIADVERPEMSWHREGPVCVGRLLVPGPERHVGFDRSGRCRPAVARRGRGQRPGSHGVAVHPPGTADRPGPRPGLLGVRRDGRPRLLPRGVAAPARGAERRPRQRDIVFTGGRSLHAGVVGRRSGHTHLFASGVEPEHFSTARTMRTPHPRPVAGYVGVIDERLDLELIAEAATSSPTGTCASSGRSPRSIATSCRSGRTCRSRAPSTTATCRRRSREFDVALMPFALNDATRSISPTKTLEYMAAGLPIVSTKVPDVVADFSDVVLLADDVVDFAHHCRAALREAGTDAWEQRIAPIVERHRWDCIAGNMSDLIDARREELERSELSLPGGHGDGLRRSA